MTIFYDPTNFEIKEFYCYPTTVIERIVEWDEGFHEGAPGMNEDVKDLFNDLIDRAEDILNTHLRDNKIAMKVIYTPTNTEFFIGYKDWNWCLGLALNTYQTGKMVEL